MKMKWIINWIRWNKLHNDGNAIDVWIHVLIRDSLLKNLIKTVK
jgi:hypothetical protein